MNLNMTYQDVRMMPIRYRHWFLKRLSKHFDKRNKMYEQAKNPSPQMKSNDSAGFEKFNEMIDNKFSS